jgi:hypothetical protein
VCARLNQGAQPQYDWIDVTVYLGDRSQLPNVRGLLGNPDGDPNLLGLSDGTVLREPVTFDTLYHHYGKSWRVPRHESLLCKDRNIEVGDPRQPFYANDLTKAQQDSARAICTKAGVKQPAALADCILDVTVLGTPRAAPGHARAPIPVAVWQAGSRPPIEVAIDIEPGEFPNLIHISNDPNRIEVTTVAILTTPTFDATTVEPSTVRFGETGTEAAPVQETLADVNGDGTLDLVLRFRTQATGLQCGDTFALLTGETVSGQAIQGSDSIVTVRGGDICP